MDKRSKYYLDRFTKQEDGINKLTVKKEAALKRIYRDAKKELESDLAVFLEKYSKANRLESADLKRMLNTTEMAKFRYDIKGYVDEIERLGKDTPEGKALKKELDIMAGRTRVSRVEALRKGIEHELNKVAMKSSDTIKNHLSDVVDKTYSEAFKIIKNNTMAKLDTKLIKRIVGQKWDSKNYSQRVWQNRRGLADKVMKTITSGIMQGHDFDRMVDGLRKKVDVGYYEARRLMHTETTFALERAKGEAFKDMGVKKYRFVAVMDKDTSEICKSLNGQVFEMKDRQIGINCPAMHPFCRSVTVPVVEKVINGEKISKKEVQKDAVDKEKIKELYKQKKELEKQIEKEKIKSKTKAIEKGEKSGIIKEKSIPLSEKELEYKSPETLFLNSKEYKDWKESIDGLEKYSIHQYSFEKYTKYNAYLRGIDTNLLKEDIEEIKAIKKALRRYQTTEKFTVYRGIRLNGEFKNPFVDNKIGDEIIIDKGFLSTTIQEKQTNSFLRNSEKEGIKFRIRVPKGKKVGAYIAEFSEYSSEEEFLMLPETKFKILKYEKIKYKVTAKHEIWLHVYDVEVL